MVGDRFDIDTYRAAIGLAATGILSIALPEAAAVRTSGRTRWAGGRCIPDGDCCTFEQPRACCSRCCCTADGGVTRTCC
jgi:hypothetical protein